MAELKSLAEIKLEVDLIMVDIEVLGENDKEEAIKYLETSLEELKLANNWEIPCIVDTVRTEDKKEEIEEKSNDDEDDNIACKRLKLETRTESDKALDQNKVDAETNSRLESDCITVKHNQQSPIGHTGETIKSKGSSFEENYESEDQNVASRGEGVQNHSSPLDSTNEYTSLAENFSQQVVNHKGETIKSEGNSFEENDELMPEDPNVASHGEGVQNHSYPLDSTNEYTSVTENFSQQGLNHKGETIKSEGSSFEENDELMSEDQNVAIYGGGIENHSYSSNSTHDYTSESENCSQQGLNQEQSEDEVYGTEKERGVSNSLKNVSGVSEIKAEISYQAEDIYSTFPHHVYSDQHQLTNSEQTEDTLLREWETGQNYRQHFDQNPNLSSSNDYYPIKVEETEYYDSSSNSELDSTAVFPNIPHPPVSHSQQSVSSHGLYNGKVPTCTECNQTFPSLGVLDNHLKNGHKEGDSFNKLSRREPTMSRQLYTRNYDAEALGMCTNEDGTFQCTICGSKSKYKYNMKLHMNRHMNRNELIQQSESATSIQPAGFNHYEQVSSSSDQSLQGQDGNSEYLLNENVSDVNQHYSMNYMLEEYEENITQEAEVALAPHAPQGYDMSQPQYNKSLTHSMNYPNSQRSYPCELCGQSFTKSDYLKRHMISHSDRFKCKTCGTGFTEQGRLNRHLQRPDNCNKFLAKRTNDVRRESSWEQQSYYPPNNDWMRNRVEHQVNPQNFPPGIQVTKKLQPSLQSSFRNPSLAEQFLNNPGLSVQIKTEPSKQY